MIPAITPFDSGVRIAVKARPGTNRPRPARLVDIGEGEQALEISVAAPPEDGKANKALIETLAKLLGIKQRDITLKSGGSGRLKLFEITGDTATLIKKLADIT